METPPPAISLHLSVIDQRLRFTESFQLKEEKSVSRQHLTLTVSPVKPGDGVSPTHPLNHYNLPLTAAVACPHSIRDKNQR